MADPRAGPSQNPEAIKEPMTSVRSQTLATNVGTGEAGVAGQRGTGGSVHSTSGRQRGDALKKHASPS